MTVYNINRGIGWASSGVEYAQAYRANIFRKLGVASRFIFTDMFQGENLAHFTANIGLKDEEVIWLYGFFTDVKIAATTFPVSEFEQTLEPGLHKVSQTNETIHYQNQEESLSVVCFLRKQDPTCVQRVEYLAEGKLIRKDYYSYTKVFTEYYAPVDDYPYLYQRTFFNEDGSVAYEENCNDEKSIYYFPDRILFSKEELIGRMLDQLHLTKKDLILVDRSTGIGQPLMRHKGEARVAVVIHAEHYNANAVTEDTILWNNYYEFPFSNAGYIDAFITSTQAQKDTLVEQFAKYTPHRPRVVVLPVGSLDQLAEPVAGRRSFSTLTCSRLATEKHIDWLVEAVALARHSLPELTFDIYGAGGQEGRLKQLIDEKDASSYIRLMGHHDLTEVYKEYEVYLTASTSEGFGLTLMEAIGSGLPIIGLDVPYGNQTFVKEGANGYLIPRQEPDDSKAYAEAFAERLIRLYRSPDRQSWHRASYEQAEAFLTTRLEESWARFIKEMVS